MTLRGATISDFQWNGVEPWLEKYDLPMKVDTSVEWSMLLGCLITDPGPLYIPPPY